MVDIQTLYFLQDNICFLSGSISLNFLFVMLYLEFYISKLVLHVLYRVPFSDKKYEELQQNWFALNKF